MSRKSLIGTIVIAFIGATIFLSTPLGLQTALLAERRFASLDDHTILAGSTLWSWSEKGEGQALLLLHGFAGDRNHWTRVAGGLNSSMRVLLPDLPGFGTSHDTISAPDYGVDAQLIRLTAWLDALKIKKVHIAGHSMGGRLAFLFASRFPDRVLSLYLICPSGIAQGRDSEFHRTLKQTGKNLALPQSVEDFENLNQLAFSQRPWIPLPLYRQLANDLLARHPTHQKIWTDLMRPAMSLELLTASLPPIPITTVWGAEDRLLNPSVLQLLKSALPTMRDELLENVGHMPLVEVPAEVSSSLNRHLNN